MKYIYLIYLAIPLLIIYVCLNHSKTHKFVKSTIDNRIYKVKISKPEIELLNANVLAKVNAKMNILFSHIHDNDTYLKHKGIRRLLKNKDVRLEQKVDKYGHVAYSINKGEIIGLCLQNKKDLNTTIFVLLHELAHVMSTKYAHDEEFWSNFSFLIKIAMEAKIYNHKNYSKEPVTYCGHRITENPYDILPTTT